ncbi:hypothetical protein WUBG_14537 [Wuchereria bancrofti]|uniref:Uncharacterized protein n=1 Tax=Wuchereria bancrofti TaxID=6293 RepID=J9AK44_WUCBA|nr:hypothetical protein WUBG_14537 [Wuchereria bancrofti]
MRPSKTGHPPKSRSSFRIDEAPVASNSSENYKQQHIGSAISSEYSSQSEYKNAVENRHSNNQHSSSRAWIQYYDPKTDGFYYDSKGSRGWRRRNPAHEKKQT